MKPKKVIIVSYYWPPAGGPGVQRWLKFAKYLPDFGWEPVLFVPENPSYPLIDESLEKEVSPNLEIIKTKIWEPYQIAEKFNRSNRKFKTGQFDVKENQSFLSKLSIFIRGNFFIPDARVFWVKPSVEFLRKYLSENHIDTIITTGPPHSLHLIGLGLKKDFPNLKWIADFRDPWTEISYYKHLKLTKWADQKHRKLEQKVFKTADITLATSFTDAENFKKKGVNAVCITNGFDENEIYQIVDNEQNTKFILSYVGVLEQLRNPQILWQVLEEIIEENQKFAQDFELKLVGKVDEKILAQMGECLKKNILNLGYLSHDKALKEMQKSEVLLITNFNQESSKGIIPGKLFEYLAMQKKILSFGPKGSDVAKILEETQAGKHFAYDEFLPIKEFILNAYNDWKQGEILINKGNIEQYSRRNLTKKLANIL